MPILDDNALEYFSRSADQTRRLGFRLGALIRSGQLICLSGDLGSGKTTLVQGLVQGWGSTDKVTSPSFVLINEYHRPDGETLFHLDAYRLTTSAEGEDLDIDDMLACGALVVEWSDHIREALPKSALAISFRWMADEHRGLILSAAGDDYHHILKQIHRQVYGGF